MFVVVFAGIQRSGGKAVFDGQRLVEVLTRLEFVILTASTIGADHGETGSTIGVVGSDLYSDQLKEFQEKIPIFYEDIEPLAKQSGNLQKGR